MAKAEKGNHWQKQYDHFGEMITDMQAVVDDPDSTAEEVAEAEETIAAMEKNQQRLVDKHGVSEKPVV